MDPANIASALDVDRRGRYRGFVLGVVNAMEGSGPSKLNGETTDEVLS